MNNIIVKGLVLVIVLLIVVFLFRIIMKPNNTMVNESNQVITNSADVATNVISNEVINTNTIYNTNSIDENAQQNTVQSNINSNTQSTNTNTNKTSTSKNTNKNTNTIQNETNNTSANSNNSTSSNINKTLFSKLDFSEFSQKKYAYIYGTKKVQACIYRNGKVELYFYNIIGDTDYLVDYMEGIWNDIRKTIRFENTYTMFDMSVTSATDDVLKFNIKNYYDLCNKLLPEHMKIGDGWIERTKNDIEYNPNGSILAIEGITSKDGRILGKMGHSERCYRGVTKNVPGNPDIKLFESGVEYYR